MYVKLPTGEGKFTVIPLTDENVFSICPICGEEHQVDMGQIVAQPDLDFYQRVCCWPCTAAINEKGLDAVMEQRKESLAYELKQQSGK